MIGELSAGLNAAVLLACGRRDAAAQFLPAGRDVAAVAARSFVAAALSLPAYVCLHLLDWVQGGVPAHPGQAFALDLVGFGLYWAGYAVLSHAIVGAIGKATAWPRYITAWNWCNAVQYMMVTAAALPVLLGLPAWVSETAGLFAMGWAFWLEWFATRLTLEIGPVSAGVITAVDVAAGMFIFGFIGTMT